MSATQQDEVLRIRAEYQRRAREIPADLYALHHPANLCMRQGQEWALLDALQAASVLPLSERTILDVGCGCGQWLAIFEQFGAVRENLAGIDLDPAREKDASRRFAGADIRLGDASHLPWPNAQFDIVFQGTVFTSILDPTMKQAVAQEMLRVLHPAGCILWYDFWANNPRNPQVRGIRRHEIQQLFPDCELRLRRVTLAPPLVRWLAPRSTPAALLLEHLRVLNTHYLAVLHSRTNAGSPATTPGQTPGADKHGR